MSYKAVIFDLFGTLVDNYTRADYEKVLVDMASILNIPPGDFMRLWSASFNDRVTGVHGDQRDSIRYICRELGIKSSKTQIEKAFQVRMDFCVRTTIPRKNSVPVLNQLRKDGYKIGLVSDCTGEIPLVWNKTPFHNLFDVTIFSCTVKTKKPDPRIYLMATDRLQVEPEDCLYIGDGSSNELTGAARVGMHPVLIRDPHDSEDAGFLIREDDWQGPRISYLTEALDLL